MECRAGSGESRGSKPGHVRLLLWVWAAQIYPSTERKPASLWGKWSIDTDPLLVLHAKP